MCCSQDNSNSNHAKLIKTPEEVEKVKVFKDNKKIKYSQKENSTVIMKDNLSHLFNLISIVYLTIANICSMIIIVSITS